MLIPERERRQVTARLMRGEKVALDWGLVLAPPTNSSGRGAGAGYRWTFYDPPIRSDGRRGARRHRTAARLDERTWLRSEDDLRALEAAAVGLPRTELDVSFRELAEHCPVDGCHERRAPAVRVADGREVVVELVRAVAEGLEVSDQGEPTGDGG